MLRKMRKNNRGSRNPRNRKSAGGRSRVAPPQFVPTLALGHKFRFTGSLSSGTPLPITRGMLLKLMSMATTTTNQFRLITAIKLKRVEIWAEPPALGSAPVTCSVEWVGNQAPSTLHSDSTMGVRAAYVSTRPPVDSSDRWWSINGINEAEVLFNINFPAGAIVDISCSLRMVDDEAPVASEAGTGGSATVGRVYYNYLDSFASKGLVPTGGVTVLP